MIPRHALDSIDGVNPSCLFISCRRWLGIEIELPDQSRHAEAYAPDRSILFQEDYAETPPSFYAAVEEYWPVYAIKMAAKGLE